MFVRPFLFCFGLGSTLDPDNIAPFIGTLFMTCAQTKIMKKRRKTQLAIKIFAYLASQNYFISARQEKNNPWSSFFFFFLPTASRKNFASRKKNRQCTPCLCPCHSRKNSETCWQTRSKTMFVHSPFALVLEAPSMHIESFLHLLVHCS